MKTLKAKWLSCLLVLCLVLAMAPAVVFAEEGAETPTGSETKTSETTTTGTTTTETTTPDESTAPTGGNTTPGTPDTTPPTTPGDTTTGGAAGNTTAGNTTAGEAPTGNEAGVPTTLDAGVASIGGKEYATLQAAFDEAVTGDTVTLLADVTNTVSFKLSGNKDITLNLGTFAVRVDGGTARENGITISGGAKLTVEGNGAIYSVTNIAVVINGNSNPADRSPINSTLTVKSGTLSGQEGAAVVFGSGATLNVKGGKLIGRDNGAVGGNGTHNSISNYGGTVINISGGELEGNITSAGYASVAIYHPQDGVLNITGGTITSTNGPCIVIRNGVLNISGDTTKIVSNGTNNGQVGDLENTTDDLGVYVDWADGYNTGAKREVTITGGTIIAPAGKMAVGVSNNAIAGSIKISAGMYSSQLSNAVTLPDGDSLVLDPKTGYYVLASTVKVEAAAGDNKVNTPTLGTSAAPTKADEQALEDAAKSVAVDTTSVSTAATAVVTELTKEENIAKTDEAARKALMDAAATLTIPYDVEQPVNLVIATYTEVTPVSCNSTTGVMQLEITPKYDTIATQTTEKDPTKLDEKNSVKVAEGTPLVVEGESKVTVAIPATFAANDDVLYVTHIKAGGNEYSKVTVADGQIEITTNGYSPFIFSKTATTITSLTFTAPVSGAVAPANFTSDGVKTGNVTWTGALKDGKFDCDVAYTAEISVAMQDGVALSLAESTGWAQKGDAVNGVYTFTKTFPKTVHTWDAGVVTKPATESEEGVRTHTCTVCGRTGTSVIAKLAPSTTTTTAPQTGDSSNLPLWAVLLLAAFAGLAVVFTQLKKSTSKR